jgi:acetyl-CoA carboxylase biotin carboxylase subunit
VVREPGELADAVSVASAEAGAAFGDPRVYLERYVERGRHVEVQILGDGERVIQLGDRDCSVQRRYQKLIEEAPAPGLDAGLRDRLRAAAVALGLSLGYRGAGTVEFLVDADRGEFYFLEVNARIQVEHPVTELVTGLDLIREQIRVAAGEKLQHTQRDIVQRGAAIEVRINAEDADKDFAPSPGTITTWRPPGGPGVRLDTHVVTGYRVPPNYDSMVAKLLVHQPTRAEAFAVMRRALREFKVEGIRTTIPLLLRIFETAEFIEGKVDTTFIERSLLPAKKS